MNRTVIANKKLINEGGLIGVTLYLSERTSKHKVLEKCCTIYVVI